MSGQLGKATWLPAVVCLLAHSSAAGQTPETLDVAVFRSVQSKAIDPWAPPVVRRLTGSITQFDAQRLVWADPDGQVQEVASDRVQRVTPAWENARASSASELVDAHQYRAAVSAIQEALKSGVPRWQQRILISRLVQSLDALGNPRTAGIIFLNLTATDPPAMLYADMPLCWTVREPDKALEAAAIEWLAGDDEHGQLLGASWLLFGQEGERARRTLAQLRSSSNSTLASLAVVQSWRLVPPPQTRAQLPDWIEYRDQLLSPLQLGPTEFLADRLMRIGEPDLAIGQWMRIATMHGDRYHRAAGALESVVSELQRQGRQEESQRLKPWIEQLRGK